MQILTPGQPVIHPRFGPGQVEFPKGATAIVRFKHGLEECPVDVLQAKPGIEALIRAGQFAPQTETVCRALAEAIVSVNDAWGVFSKSRIALLPHQLWVCHRVLRDWPTQFLVADDVGLGKTVEAGLILWPLLAQGLVKRLLIICPASLVEQWQFRLREMFDIRLTRYLPEADTPKADFWNANNQVVVSLQTIRDDHKKRHERLFAAEPWDLLIVDEAHHLNADEDRGATLGYRLVDELVERNLVRARLFFTGTPHRGKDYGFFALLRLLRPDLFSPKEPTTPQIPHIREVLIRNNKQNVTDMTGGKLFKPVANHPETYAYSEEEAEFYALLTDFIEEGKAYASGLDEGEQRAVILVLIAMQKLASSSIAAIRRAMTRRLDRLRRQEAELRDAKARQKVVQEMLRNADESKSDFLSEQLQDYEEKILALSSALALVENEIPALETLVDMASAIRRETKIAAILDVLETRYPDRSVLFFTEYKATQALLMSALMQRYGEDCVTFINGDERVEGVVGPDGRERTIALNRADAASLFNAGQVRFLVSTEAAGEGIDLQESCHTLIHVDLPWNPMRLHQRVGRLNRYGQKHPVEVVTLRNPATVESRIWDKLNEKIQNIMRALGNAMDDPEDLLQLVLGMTSSGFFTHLFAEGSGVAPEKLSSWFDEKTKTFGGRDAIATVQTLLGNSARFDLSDLDRIPPKDLADLQPFFETMLKLNKRQIHREDQGLAFKTPETWLQDSGVLTRYEGLVFSRDLRGKDAVRRVLGVGHKVFDQAVRQATSYEHALAALPGLEHPLAIWTAYDRITSQDGYVHQVVIGVTGEALLKDWEVIDLLNRALSMKASESTSNAACDADKLLRFLDKAKTTLQAKLPAMQLPFEVPEIRLLNLFVPA